jgi:hypothetical protein
MRQALCNVNDRHHVINGKTHKYVNIKSSKGCMFRKRIWLKHVTVTRTILQFYHHLVSRLYESCQSDLNVSRQQEYQNDKNTVSLLKKYL